MRHQPICDANADCLNASPTASDRSGAQFGALAKIVRGSTPPQRAGLKTAPLRAQSVEHVCEEGTERARGDARESVAWHQRLDEPGQPVKKKRVVDADGLLLQTARATLGQAKM